MQHCAGVNARFVAPFTSSPNKGTNMFKILIVVNGSEHAHRAIDAVAKLAQSSVELEAVLLHVSPEPIFYGDYFANTIQSIQEGQ